MTKTLIQEQPKVYQTGCCPRFDPSSYDQKAVTWKDKLFVKGHVVSFMHVPLNFGRVVSRLQKQIVDAGAEIEGNLILSDETSSWGTDLFIAVSKAIPGLKMEKLSGVYLMRVFEGEFRMIPEFMKITEQYLKETGKVAKHWYLFYPYCPKCAKAYGTNYIVIFARIS